MVEKGHGRSTVDPSTLDTPGRGNDGAKQEGKSHKAKEKTHAKIFSAKKAIRVLVTSHDAFLASCARPYITKEVMLAQLQKQPHRGRKQPAGPKGAYAYVDEPLGNGCSGTVFRAVHSATGTSVAIKVVPLVESRVQYIENELSIHQSLRHDGIVELYDWFLNKTELHMVQQLVPHGSLDNYADFTVAEVALLLKKLAAAVGYLHGLGFVHADIKPENVLMSETGLPLLADFGMSLRPSYEQPDMLRGTPEFMAPELWAGRCNSTKSDVWALGVLAYELLTGSVPFDAAECVARTALSKGNLQDDAFQFIALLLRKDPAERPEIAEILTHPWLNAAH
ncbi:aurora kinase A isoform X1 [Achlya hypogyna]|uniref:Aurora kinase A isoform X1 n=1 Tax=Achlya hypogyna TaxID=1202772 RepID=A0A1V9YID0_ACHHY|nr:aurora kinase A isoform X1 [Achlya hypogyna]